MGNFSCGYFTKLRVVIIFLMTLTHALMIASFAASKWDGFFYDLQYNNMVMNAHQNLWTLYDNNKDDPSLAYFRLGNIKLEWKKIVLALEITALSVAFLCLCSLLILIFVKRLTQNRTLVIISIFTLAFLCAASGVSVIYGVMYYMKHYKDNVSENVLTPSNGIPLEKHQLTWAPWLCLSAGGMYIVCGLLLLLDAILFVTTKKRITPSSES